MAPGRNDAHANHDAPAVRGPAACREALATEAQRAPDALDPRRIGLLVWNIQKGGNPRHADDLARLAAGKDLVLIQEARLEPGPAPTRESPRFWSFAPGYATARYATGVMTWSRTVPLQHCQLSEREPWIRSTKAIDITRFGLAGTAATLAVVNVHAVNFTFGVADFERQIGQVADALLRHAGPIILAGDFNTWRTRRLEVLQALAHRLQLEELSFEVDDRVAPLGTVVDRIFVRGLRAVAAETSVVSSSDHNPMSAELSLVP